MLWPEVEEMQQFLVLQDLGYVRHCKENAPNYMYALLRSTGVAGQNIPLAGLYPGMLWPWPIYTPGVYYGLGQLIPPQAIIFPYAD